MKRIAVILALSALFAVALISVSHYFGSDNGSAVAEQQQKQYVCPMHPDVVSDKPGKCPKCGMNLVIRKIKEEKSGNAGKQEGLSPDSMLNQAHSLVDGAKEMLAADGKYHCCIEDRCDECALEHHNCSCAPDLKAGRGVCSQCYGGWQRGEGDISGIDPKSVKGNFHDHAHEH
jgi:hypothetical protein